MKWRSLHTCACMCRFPLFSLHLSNRYLKFWAGRYLQVSLSEISGSYSEYKFSQVDEVEFASR
ncbi:hypothetical protein GQ55_1G102000 [Panicum hallii var. hallii]|uniref:Uncharacterized protein n=2 Tax=Panicum hallii TaxID=206008 RepID=A0A2T7F484_9POAL|nr:hypothetical protein GQ55_1G102000 [Panicum hallii var. hallii]PVH65924.1 hypothetical protein PAHAL_1G104600 [Panicum hallii]